MLKITARIIRGAKIIRNGRLQNSFEQRHFTHCTFAALEQEDFYIESGKYVFTAAYHLKRGSCCGSRCRHCPFLPKYKKFSRTVDPEALKDAKGKE